MQAILGTGGRYSKGVNFRRSAGCAVNENVFNIFSGDKTQSMEIKYPWRIGCVTSRGKYCTQRIKACNQRNCSSPSSYARSWWRYVRTWLSLSCINPNNGVSMQCVFQVRRYLFRVCISRVWKQRERTNKEKREKKK